MSYNDELIAGGDDEITIEETTAYRWVCRACYMTGPLEMDDSLAQEMGDNHVCGTDLP